MAPRHPEAPPGPFRLLSPRRGSLPLCVSVWTHCRHLPPIPRPVNPGSARAPPPIAAGGRAPGARPDSPTAEAAVAQRGPVPHPQSLSAASPSARRPGADAADAIVSHAPLKARRWPPLPFRAGVAGADGAGGRRGKGQAHCAGDSAGHHDKISQSRHRPALRPAGSLLETPGPRP